MQGVDGKRQSGNDTAIKTVIPTDCCIVHIHSPAMAFHVIWFASWKTPYSNYEFSADSCISNAIVFIIVYEHFLR